MRTPALCVFAFLLGAPAFAQDFFGSGKPPSFREEDVDRRFARSRFGKMLSEGSDNPNCQVLMGAFYTVLADMAPTLHKRDGDFTVDNALLQALATQMTNARFPAAAYLTAMVRRVEIDRKLPHAWLETAARYQIRIAHLDQQGRVAEQLIGPDLSKLQYLADGLQPIDSFGFTLDALRQQQELLVNRATAASSTSEREFREKFLDRDVTWTNLRLVELGPEKRPGKKGRKGKAAVEEEGNALVAKLEIIPPPDDGDLFRFQATVAMLKPKPKAVVVRLTAKLADKQYLPLEKLPRNTRVMVKGRFWEMNKNVTELELRDAVIFVAPDWSPGVVLVDPAAVAQCPAALNELSGTASGAAQPGGFGQHQ